MIPILVYSHSSCDFIWPVTIGQLVKYAPKSELHFALDSECKNQNVIFPSSWNIHKYQDLGLWSKKCLSVLKK